MPQRSDEGNENIEVSPESQLAGFLAKYDPKIATVAEQVLAKMRQRLPTCLQLVYDNYNALAVGFGPTGRASDAIFSIAVFPRWVSLFFLQAKGLSDPGKMLKGSGKKARHVVLTEANDLDDPRIVALMDQALERAAASFLPEVSYRLIIKSVSAKQRPRRPASGSVEVAGLKPATSKSKLPKPASEKEATRPLAKAKKARRKTRRR